MINSLVGSLYLRVLPLPALDRTGKSTLLQHLLPDYRYVTLDDPVLRGQALSDPRLFFDSLGEKAILTRFSLRRTFSRMSK